MTAGVSMWAEEGARAVARPLELALTPKEVFAAWPRGVPLAALWSGGEVQERTRWTVLAVPSRVEGEGFCPALGTGSEGPPFQGGWIGVLRYEYGAEIEPAAGRRGGEGAVRWMRCDDALMYDRVEERWWSVGRVPELEVGQGAEEFAVGALADSMTRGEYESKVARVIEYIRAGDVYQVNLAHFLSGEFRGSARGFGLRMMEVAEPWYGAYVEMGGEVICSASPELFLEIDAARRVVTRPMKGTRRGSAAAAELELSAKDMAELNMITDLMRNDLGRVCELGSVRVEKARDVERHGGASKRASEGLWQATSMVSGVLRNGATLKDVLAATFPGGSITGAPKIRAMQIISELEGRERGVYCGAIGFVSRSGHAAFNVAIRTAAIAGGVVSYGVGAGIVADSEPGAEWRETMDKAWVFLRAAGKGVGA